MIKSTSITYEHRSNRRRTLFLARAVGATALAAWLSGCAALGAVGAASTALDKVMDVSGLRRERAGEGSKPVEVAQKLWRWFVTDADIYTHLGVTLVETLLASVQDLTWDVTEGRMKRLEHLYDRTRFFRRHR